MTTQNAGGQNHGDVSAISDATNTVVAAVPVGGNPTGVAFDWDYREAGLDAAEKYGSVLPEQDLDSVRTNKVAIKGPITTPRGGNGTSGARSTSAGRATGS